MNFLKVVNYASHEFLGQIELNHYAKTPKTKLTHPKGVDIDFRERFSTCFCREKTRLS